jgi:inner membrane protein
MPTIMTHAVAASTLVRLVTPHRRLGAPFWALCAGLAMLPDLDVIAYAFPVAYDSIWAHRGISHSFLAAGIVAALATLWARRRVPLRAPVLWLCFALAMASHGVIDTMTAGGKGVALLAPFDATRYSSPWRPMRASPIGAAFFSRWGLSVLTGEVVCVWVPCAAALLIARAARDARSDREG